MQHDCARDHRYYRTKYWKQFLIVQSIRDLFVIYSLLFGSPKISAIYNYFLSITCWIRVCLNLFCATNFAIFWWLS
jgi:hypothetical protein